MLHFTLCIALGLGCFQNKGPQPLALGPIILKTPQSTTLPYTKIESKVQLIWYDVLKASTR